MEAGAARRNLIVRVRGTDFRFRAESFGWPSRRPTQAGLGGMAHRAVLDVDLAEVGDPVRALPDCGDSRSSCGPQANPSRLRAVLGSTKT